MRGLGMDSITGMTRAAWRVLVVLVGALAVAPIALAQSLYFDRLPLAELAVKPPTERVSGAPGTMQVVETGCEAKPIAGARQRIVDVVLQEWAYFGFSVADETAEPVRRSGGNPFGRNASGNSPGNTADSGETVAAAPEPRRSWRRFSWLDLEESERLADSIAGYWAITGDGSWIVSRQNEVWNGSGVGARWRDPWSAAFISWVMCESGLGDDDRFDRAIAHHTYIDQAIRARDLGINETAYVAYDVGEAVVEPGDLVCSARRPTYRSLDERRGQLGDGIRSHCDIVIKLEPHNDRILSVGGNVRGSVSLKLMPADFEADDEGSDQVAEIGRGNDRVFAHLKLRDESLADDPVSLSPTIRRLGEEPELIERVRATLEQAVRSLSASVLL